MKPNPIQTHRKSVAGFTLVELMVVVAIIGILAAVAGPRVQAFRARGVQAEVKSSLHNMYLSMISFEDSNDRFPDSGGNGVACVDNQPCGAAPDQLTFRQPANSKYLYGYNSATEGFLLGGSSRRPLLNGNRDRWAMNTNKLLCSNFDAASSTTQAAQDQARSRCAAGNMRGADVAIGDNGAPTTAPVVGVNGADAKQ